MTIKQKAKKLAMIVASLAVMLCIAIVSTAWLGIRQADKRQAQDRLVASPKTGFFVTAYDTRIFVQTVGRTGAPAVVFIHGTGAWSEIWRPYMNMLADMGYQAIAIDLPPFGYSLPPESGNYTKTAQGKRILAVLDRMKIQKASFVSHSIGSSPLMEALLAAPDKVDRLIMISPALGLESPLTDGKNTMLQSLLRKKWISEPIAACVFTNPALTTTLVRNFVTEKDKVDSAWVDLYRKPFTLTNSYQGIALWIPELLAGRSELRSDNPESYKTIGFPTALIWGKDDQVTPISQGKYLKSIIPHSELKVLPGGHVPMIEEPELFRAALKETFQRSITYTRP